MTKQSSNNISKLTVREEKPSCAYGKVRFSLVKIVMSLLFGSGLVILGYFLLGSKQSDKLLKTQKSINAGKGATPGNKHQTIRDAQPKAATVNEDQQSENEETVDELDKILANLKLIEKAELEKMKAEIEGMIKFIQKIYLNGMVFELQEMVNDLQEMVNDPQEMNDNPEKRVGILQEMLKTLDKWVTYLIEYRGTEKEKDIHKAIMSRLDSHNILVKFRSAKIRADEAAKAARRF
ncbi:hypothetical protein GINT2_001533 [Glugoides intestinalis]